MNTCNMQKLYCIEMIPIRQPDYDVDLKDPLIHAMALRHGIADQRDRHFHRVRQRLAVFTKKKAARDFAKQSCINEYWNAKVREVRIMDASKEELQ